MTDLDGDGDLDAYFDNTVWYNDGNGTFQAGDKSIGNGDPSFEDLNGDGFTDAIVMNRVFLNDKTWNFSVIQDLGNGILGSILYDIDRDQDPDLVTLYADSDSLWYNDGTGHFKNTGKSFGGWAQSGYAFGDFDGDHDTDLFVTIPHNPPPPPFNPKPDYLLLNNGNQNFEKSAQSFPAVMSRMVAKGDIDRDDDLDLLIGNQSSFIQLWINGGKGIFEQSLQRLSNTSANEFLVDVDNDGDLDAFVLRGGPMDSGKTNELWLNQDGQFLDSGLQLGESNSMSAAFGDIDNDGDLDAIIGNIDLQNNGAPNKVYLNMLIDHSEIRGNYLGQPLPGEIPLVFARGIVSTDSQEHGAPAFSPDGNEIFWWVNRRTEPGSDEWTGSGMMMQRVGDHWTEPEMSQYSGAVFSPDENRLYFDGLSTKPDSIGKGPYYVEKKGDGWNEQRSINLINRFPELQFAYNLSIARNGTLYFIGYAEGYRGNFGIYRSEPVDGVYSKPELLPPNINIPGNVVNWTPFIAPDESYLIFSSTRDASENELDMDLFISFRQPDSSWTTPVNLGKPINTDQQERFPAVSPDGKFLFFTRDTPDHDDDVFWVSSGIIDRLRE